MSREKIVSELDWDTRVWKNKQKARRVLETANMSLKVKSVSITGTVTSTVVKADVFCREVTTYLRQRHSSSG
jgi:hypothetical protein